LTEDLKNPDVLYLGTETGLFVSIDRAKTWARLKANLPTVRIDEITLHPRDNAMLIATHGRAIWILDHLEPIQEFAATQAATADAALFTPPSAMYRRPARDRNYEFWGDQVFYGENPPQAAIFTWNLKKPVGSVALRVTDAAGREVREISGPVLAKSNGAGMQSACWDLRVQPLPSALAGGAGPAPGGQGAQPAGSGAGTPVASPFGAGCATSGGGFGGGGFFGGASTAGPFVMPGTYNVALVVDGKTVDTRPLRVMADPEVALSAVEARRMFDMAMELHDLQKRGTAAADALRPLVTRLTELAKEIGTRTDVPAEVKTAFEAYHKEVTALAPTLIMQPGGGGFGGGGGQGGPGGAAAQLNVLTRLGQAKNGLMATMPVTASTTRAYSEAKTNVPKAIVDANALFAKGAALSGSLATYKLKLEAPSPVK
jgi:hypothetical protein